jgi:hypothetical protein
MDTDAASAEASPRETHPAKAGRRPTIILTSGTNLLQFQKSIKRIVKGSFVFRSTKNGTRVHTKEMADFSAIKSFFLSKKLSFYTYFPKSQKPIKAVIRHLPPKHASGRNLRSPGGTWL